MPRRTAGSRCGSTRSRPRTTSCCCSAMPRPPPGRTAAAATATNSTCWPMPTGRRGCTRSRTSAWCAARRAPTRPRSWCCCTRPTGARRAAPRHGWRAGTWRITCTSARRWSATSARLARLISRTGVGLVLAGGGARGLAHLGVYRALQERGIEIDVVGGTSIGAVMAAYVAADRPIDDITANARQAFATNPTGDFNLIPMVSLIKGLRLRRIVDQAPAGADRLRGAGSRTCGRATTASPPTTRRRASRSCGAARCWTRCSPAARSPAHCRR